MTTEHEYSAIGHSRTRVGRVLGIISGAIAGGAAASVGWLIDWLTDKNLWTPPPLVLWPLSGTVVFAIVFFIFDKVVWSSPRIARAVGVPNLSGQWVVAGETRDMESKTTHQWAGIITITQSYEKIHVFLRTHQSSSNSISAAIIPEGSAGYRLIYSYRNNPRAGEAELNPHMGHADLLFSPDLQTADGDYFNGKGRITFGRMRLTKEAH